MEKPREHLLHPLAGRDYVSVQHVHRYRFADAFLRPGWRVLDVACGSGDGSRLITGRGRTIVSLDSDYRGVAAAKARGLRELVQADARESSFADGSFDAVVAFEVIEHVTDGPGFVREMKRVLKPGGLLLCSTPNIRFTVHPPYHVKEYFVREYHNLIGEHFPDTDRFVQHFSLRDYTQGVTRRTLGKIADLLGIKPLWRRLRGGRRAPPAAPPGATLAQAAPAAQPAGASSESAPAPAPPAGWQPFYEVLPWSRRRRSLVRIMVTASRKERAS